MGPEDRRHVWQTAIARGRTSQSEPAQDQARVAGHRSDQSELACWRRSALARPRWAFSNAMSANGEHAEIVITERVYRVRINELV